MQQKILTTSKVNLSKSAQQIFKALETVESILPTPFYWMDADGVVLGINDLCAKAMGTTREIIGKKPYAFYKEEIAEHILMHNTEVIRQEKILAQEEWIEDVTTKERKCFSSIKAPLYDDEGKVIGIVGTSIEITAQKETEALKLEKERQQIALLEQKEKFVMIARKVAHDINSPLASIKMILPACSALNAANWIAQQIRLSTNSIVVILDDDESIHGAWDMRFQPYLNSYPNLQPQHFTHRQQALDFFNKLSQESKDRVTFLCDYELIGQIKNGLQIIEESGIKNTILVTSYDANPKIRDKASELGVKILPKQMASIVPIDI